MWWEPVKSNKTTDETRVGGREESARRTLGEKKEEGKRPSSVAWKSRSN